MWEWPFNYIFFCSCTAWIYPLPLVLPFISLWWNLIAHWNTRSPNFSWLPPAFTIIKTFALGYVGLVFALLILSLPLGTMGCSGGCYANTAIGWVIVEYLVALLFFPCFLGCAVVSSSRTLRVSVQLRKASVSIRGLWAYPHIESFELNPLLQLLCCCCCCLKTLPFTFNSSRNKGELEEASHIESSYLLGHGNFPSEAISSLSSPPSSSSTFNVDSSVSSSQVLSTWLINQLPKQGLSAVETEMLKGAFEGYCKGAAVVLSRDPGLLGSYHAALQEQQENEERREQFIKSAQERQKQKQMEKEQERLEKERKEQERLAAARAEAERLSYLALVASSSSSSSSSLAKPSHLASNVDSSSSSFSSFNIHKPIDEEEDEIAMIKQRNKQTSYASASPSPLYSNNSNYVSTSQTLLSSNSSAAPAVSVSTSVASDRARECSICLEGTAESALIPCGHRLCPSCAEKFMEKPCPFCREPIQGFLKKIY